MANSGAPVLSLGEETRAVIERKFAYKRTLARAREQELFGVFEEQLTEEETWALKFLYAYMPLNDLADYDGELFLNHVRTTLNIRRTVPWGGRVPDHEFLHFVLPYRVNNENIEDSRGILHGELAKRVSGLTMEAAILETNHWCHEKATYVSTDLRTVSPLTLIRTALGRCGEESTLAVAALRSIGIPARQCYTPRWAHSDSNHAWVEAWADGKWHYIGACEPEPRLNMGWFSGPARRAMLVNTRVPSNYPGPEAITLAHEWYTEINLLDAYAPTRTVRVRIKDEQDRPAAGAVVLLQVYNYAEFTPIARLVANDRGEASLTTGFGDLYVHASRGERWGEKKLEASGDAVLELKLDRVEQEAGAVVDVDMVPPPERAGDASPEIPEEELRRHNARVQEGARIRTSFEATFIREPEAGTLAGELGLPADRVWHVLKDARGNGREIAAFLREQTPAHGELPLRLLESLNAKDWTDTFRPTLEDHLTGALPFRDLYDEDTFVKYILCPRVLFEMIVPYKAAFQAAIPAEAQERYRRDPSRWADRLAGDFEVIEGMTYYQGSATPIGSYRLGKGDRASRDILFVAACRSIGIPARLHLVHRKPQYWTDGAWRDAAFEPAAELPDAKPPAAQAETGSVTLLRDATADAEGEGAAAAYFDNFTFARLDNGQYQTLFYPHGKADVYEEPFELAAGEYRLLTGTRLNDGTTLVRLANFTLRPGEHVRLPLTFRKQTAVIPVLGASEPAWPFALPDGTERSLGELTGSGSAVLAWIEPDREPSKHLLRELGELAAEYTKLGAPVLLAVGDEGWTASFDPSAYDRLPVGTAFVRDRGGASMREAAARLGLAVAAELPLVLALDGAGRIRYAAAGYKLGIGREALQVLARLTVQR